MINEKFTITINGNKFEAPQGDFIPKAAESLLLAGHLRHMLTACEEPVKLDISDADRETIEKRLAELEEWLQPSITRLGDVVASVDIEEIGKFSLNYLGHTISAFSELLAMVQEVMRRLEEDKKA
ncbi:hypothetical protein Q9L42_010465 [Methylomarinum sp. Ch1-1]|uniref:Uncharacterized protein n=1 Tax=Methylomarinum roseum TaxID=3067653 RepID=A0AAU7NPB4_9GAMM|nr:hypothetical protein [Methylomarinum sp. Ch1-1]MDP4521322.1 hypothetical protein [Methylomarinum sp. Ch1-1]